ncbi:MAG: hypothetical protein AAGB46_18635 [Verrucomicrobiota bacterium]
MSSISDLKNLLTGSEASQLSHDAMMSLRDLAGSIEKSRCRLEEMLEEMDRETLPGSSRKALDAMREGEGSSKYLD